LKTFVTCLALWLTFAAGPVFGRGGGGCFEEGTPVLVPGGFVPIEQLNPGDLVVGGNVDAINCVEPDEYLELDGGVHVTAKHPFQIAPGIFRVAERVFPHARRVSAQRPAYNLLISPGGTYIAGGYLVHNKGCFLPDTPILRPDGTETRIRDVRVGDELLAFTPDGEVVHARVHNVITHDVDEYLEVATEHALLRVTVEHPFYVGDGTFKTLEALQIGDAVYAYDGRGLSAQHILSIAHIRGRTRVYNLQTDAPNTFFANGIAVHNKGGCFPAGTPISTPAGTVAIENLRPGDIVMTGQGGTTVVQATFVTKSRVLTLLTDHGTLRTTAEHPLFCADGRFRLAGELSRGDRLQNATIKGCVTGNEELVHNLEVGAPHTFVAEGFVVHNKGGGCFQAGTRVRTPQGEVMIETLRPGDLVLAGNGYTTRVEAVQVTRDQVLMLETSAGTLRTTAEHPLLCADGRFRLAGELTRGDRLENATIQRCVVGGEQTVYNLTVGTPHTFIADGFVVHNKGGGFHGGGYHGGHGGGSGGDVPDEVMFLIIAGIVVVVAISKVALANQAKDEDLDFTYSATAVAAKADKTRKLLEFIAKVDPNFKEEALRQRATETFVKLQECWQAREYGPMQALMMPDLYAEHLAQLQSLHRNHEINRIDRLRVEQADIVNVRYEEKENDREFTALITASAQDYYVDDRTNSFLRGDDAPARFQEFWTFQRQNGSWLLREIEQSRESNKLKEQNFFPQFTDAAVDKVYGKTAGQEGPAGPWLEKSVETKATKIDRLLNFLVQTDKLWDRQTMLERAREVFMDVMLAREANDPTAVKDDEVFPATALDLRQQIGKQRAANLSIEYRNLCIRKVELILVRNFTDNSQDEYTVRLSAHAQKIIKRAGQVVSQDEYVTPFEEYWTFGRLDGQWKLKEVLPPSRGQELVDLENVDRDSSAAQLQWYYQHNRAT
jgi:predicted lipid-binding transport protein (Tim44 family)